MLAAAVGALALPAAARATDTPTGADERNAAQECRYERGTSAATREAFEARYRTFGRCVSARARDEASERAAARSNAAQACQAEKKRGGNAFGKCVSQAAKAAQEKADKEDREAAGDRKSAAKQCAQERGTTAESRNAFAKKYGTNGNRRNAFGKCVSKLARSLGESH
jgi:hypothetical protein